MLPHMSPFLFLLLISTIVLYFSLLFRALRTVGRVCAFPPSCVSHTLFVAFQNWVEARIPIILLSLGHWYPPV
ncbi:hypothetical protein BKA83DRAFT_4190826 [Pisolithus microcarpus]|nr:hypothetical protein BKA83DRAFT_4190826 [Pisolithus microcarpus]